MNTKLKFKSLGNDMFEIVDIFTDKGHICSYKDFRIGSKIIKERVENTKGYTIKVIEY